VGIVTHAAVPVGDRLVNRAVGKGVPKVRVAGETEIGAGRTEQLRVGRGSMGVVAPGAAPPGEGFVEHGGVGAFGHVVVAVGAETCLRFCQKRRLGPAVGAVAGRALPVPEGNMAMLQAGGFRLLPMAGEAQPGLPAAGEEGRLIAAVGLVAGQALSPGEGEVKAGLGCLVPNVLVARGADHRRFVFQERRLPTDVRRVAIQAVPLHGGMGNRRVPRGIDHVLVAARAEGVGRLLEQAVTSPVGRVAEIAGQGGEGSVGGNDPLVLPGIVVTDKAEVVGAASNQIRAVGAMGRMAEEAIPLGGRRMPPGGGRDLGHVVVTIEAEGLPGVGQRLRISQDILVAGIAVPRGVGLVDETASCLGGSVRIVAG